MKKKLVVIAMSVTLLSACATDPMTGESRVSNLGKGAGIGAAVGAGAGALFGGNKLKNAGLGALAGGAVGAAVGYYMDKQEEEIQQSLQGTGIKVQRTAKNTLNLNMPSSVTFTKDSSTLMPQAQQSLNQVGRVLKKYPQSTINVIGHTDDTGTDSHNQTLSEQRAASVSAYLSQQGVMPDRLSQSGMGETQPKVPNDSEANRSENRRVEITIVANNDAGSTDNQNGTENTNGNTDGNMNMQPQNLQNGSQGMRRKGQGQRNNRRNNNYNNY
jgi:outer membrane protein OmpA-like peptidoglycan-associated protein